jgi:hypothetical protein
VRRFDPEKCQKLTGCCPNRNPFERSLRRLLPTNLGEAEDKQWQLFEPQGQGNITVKLKLLIFELLAGYGCLFFGYAPGPDLAYQDAVMETEAFITSENSCISKSCRARAGL